MLYGNNDVCLLLLYLCLYRYISVCVCVCIIFQLNSKNGFGCCYYGHAVVDAIHGFQLENWVSHSYAVQLSLFFLLFLLSIGQWPYDYGHKCILNIQHIQSRTIYVRTLQFSTQITVHNPSTVNCVKCAKLRHWMWKQENHRRSIHSILCFHSLSLLLNILSSFLFRNDSLHDLIAQCVLNRIHCFEWKGYK